MDIRAIISNHRDFHQPVASYDIAFHHIPVTPDTKDRAEDRLHEVLVQENVKLVVLARYMQVLSERLCNALSGRAISIHHSLLPSLKGAPVSTGLRPGREADRRVLTNGHKAVVFR